MKQTAKWIVGLGMLAFCLQMRPCPHGNCPAGRCLGDGPRPMGWQLISAEKAVLLPQKDSLEFALPDSLPYSNKAQEH